MKQTFASRYASMSDEQLEYEAVHSYGFSIDARDAMRQEFDKRGLIYDEKLSVRYDAAQSRDEQLVRQQQTLGQFFEKHPILTVIIIFIIIRMAYKLISTAFG